MDRSAKTLIKLIGILAILVAVILPLYSITFSVTWVNDKKPADAPADYSSTILDLGIFSHKLIGVDFNNQTNTFEEIPVNQDDSFVKAIDSIQKLVSMLFLVSIILSFLGLLISWKKETKFGGFLMILGIIAGSILIVIISLLNSILTQALINNGGIESNGAIIFDNTITVGSETYTWRVTDTLQIGMAYYLIALGLIIQFISLFIPVDTYYYDE